MFQSSSSSSTSSRNRNKSETSKPSPLSSNHNHNNHVSPQPPTPVPLPSPVPLTTSSTTSSTTTTNMTSTSTTPSLAPSRTDSISSDMNAGPAAAGTGVGTVINTATYETTHPGLINLGNTCYLNSVMQALSVTTRLSEFLEVGSEVGREGVLVDDDEEDDDDDDDGGYQDDVDSDDEGNVGVNRVPRLPISPSLAFLSSSQPGPPTTTTPIPMPLTSSFLTVLKQLHPLPQHPPSYSSSPIITTTATASTIKAPARGGGGGGGSISPRVLLKNLAEKNEAYNDYGQQDSHELLRILLGGMEIEETDLIRHLKKERKNRSSTSHHQKRHQHHPHPHPPPPPSSSSKKSSANSLRKRGQTDATIRPDDVVGSGEVSGVGKGEGVGVGEEVKVGEGEGEGAGEDGKGKGEGRVGGKTEGVNGEIKLEVDPLHEVPPTTTRGQPVETEELPTPTTNRPTPTLPINSSSEPLPQHTEPETPIATPTPPEAPRREGGNDADDERPSLRIQSLPTNASVASSIQGVTWDRSLSHAGSDDSGLEPLLEKGEVEEERERGEGGKGGQGEVGVGVEGKESEVSDAVGDGRTVDGGLVDKQELVSQAQHRPEVPSELSEQTVSLAADTPGPTSTAPPSELEETDFGEDEEEEGEPGSIVSDVDSEDTDTESSNSDLEFSSEPRNSAQSLPSSASGAAAGGKRVVSGPPSSHPSFFVNHSPFSFHPSTSSSPRGRLLNLANGNGRGADSKTMMTPNVLDVGPISPRTQMKEFVVADRNNLDEEDLLATPTPGDNKGFTIVNGNGNGNGGVHPSSNPFTPSTEFARVSQRSGGGVDGGDGSLEAGGYGGLDGDGVEGMKRKGKRDNGKEREWTPFVGLVFGGKLASVIVCEECKNVSIMREEFLDLSVPIKNEAQAKVRKRDRLRSLLTRSKDPLKPAVKPSDKHHKAHFFLTQSETEGSDQDDKKITLLSEEEDNNAKVKRRRSLDPAVLRSRKGFWLGGEKDKEKDEKRSSLSKSGDSSPLARKSAPNKTTERVYTPRIPNPTPEEQAYIRRLLADIPGHNPLQHLRVAQPDGPSSVHSPAMAALAPFASRGSGSSNPVPDQTTTGLYESLRQFTAVEVLEGENAFQCRRCWKYMHPQMVETLKSRGREEKAEKRREKLEKRLAQKREKEAKKAAEVGVEKAGRSQRFESAPSDQEVEGGDGKAVSASEAGESAGVEGTEAAVPRDENGGEPRVLPTIACQEVDPSVVPPNPVSPSIAAASLAPSPAFSPRNLDLPKSPVPSHLSLAPTTTSTSGYASGSDASTHETETDFTGEAEGSVGGADRKDSGDSAAGAAGGTNMPSATQSEQSLPASVSFATPTSTREKDSAVLSPPPRASRFILRRAHKRYLISELPSVLVIHLKRFQQTSKSSVFGSVFSNLKKIDDFVSFPEILDLNPFLEPPKDSHETQGRTSERRSWLHHQPQAIRPSVPADPTRPSTKYRLYAVVNHIGGMQSGHYTSYILTDQLKLDPAKGGAVRETEASRQTTPDERKASVPTSETSSQTSKSETKSRATSPGTSQHHRVRQWVYCSDTTVKPVSLKEVMASKAYMLYYERIP